jgi:methyl-CpG-binding domain protein 4
MLLQEALKQEPWRMLVACILLNRTGRDAVEKVIWNLFEEFPDAASMCEADVGKVETMIRSLGLQRRRANILVAFSCAWVLSEWKRPEDLPGIGEYGADSFRIFVEGRSDVDPKDKELKAYLKQRRRDI